MGAATTTLLVLPLFIMGRFNDLAMRASIPALFVVALLVLRALGSTRLSLDVPKLVDLYRAGRLQLDELISGRYPLESINEAIEAVQRGEALRNIIVFSSGSV